MPLMIAYGSNLNPAQMLARVGAFTVHGVGVVPNYKLAFAGQSRRWGGAVATLVKSVGSETPVVVYELNDEQMATMDVNEGVGIGVYRKQMLKVRLYGGATVNAVVYLHNSDGLGDPSVEYLEAVRKGYRAFDLDPSDTVLNEYE